MNDQESPCSSWLLRTHFSRAVCHRPGTCTWLNPMSDGVSFLAEEKSKHDNAHKELLIRKSSLDSGTSSRNNKNEGAKEAVDFSFPSPICSSTLSMLSESSVHSKSTFDYFSPSSDEETGTNSAQLARRSWSDSSSLLTSLLNTLPSRWSVSSYSIKGNQEHPADDPLKGSWFSWLSTKVSPKSSPKVSPTTSPRGSPRGSFRYSTYTKDSIESDRDDSAHSKNRSDIQRAPSWSQHLFHSGNERAVLSAEKWMVDLSQLFLAERFACGNHSRLYHGKYRDDPVAVKVIRQPDDDGLLADRLEQIFINEVTMLSILKHRNVIEFVAACKKPPVLCVITEYLSGGSVRSFLHKREGRLLPLDQVLRMALDVASGMEYLHLKGIIHRDLKSENLVLGENGIVKILDFGVSCFESHCDYKADNPGTYRWMAPEMLCHKPYTKKVDVFSFGIVLWELITARVPYEEMGAVQAAFCVLHKDMRPPVPADCPPGLKDIMRSCWSTDPKERPEFWEIMRSLTLCKQSLNTSEVPTLGSPQHYSSMPSWLESE